MQMTFVLMLFESEMRVNQKEKFLNRALLNADVSFRFFFVEELNLT